jgi:hypothetical protein
MCPPSFEKADGSNVQLKAIKGSKKISGACPTSTEKVSETGVRLIATMAVIALLVSLFVLQPYKAYNVALMAFMTVDFGLRGFGYKKYSPLAKLSSAIISVFKLGSKPINAGPKIFAAKIGFFCSLATAAFLALNWTTAAIAVAAMFLSCAALESFFNY